jgi:hypothetical protein
VNTVVILFYKKKFNKRFSTFDLLQIDRLREILPRDIHIAFSGEEKLMSAADAVVFDLPFMRNFFARGPEKPKGSVWVAWCLESFSARPWMNEEFVTSKIDLWMSYKQDADVVMPYFQYDFLEKFAAAPKKKNADVCMFISNPKDISNRTTYLSELAGYIKIDSYGNWLSNKKLAEDNGYAAKLKAIESYRFTIAYENTTEQDYVTEKFFEPLTAGSVPVYFGAPNISDYAPGANSFIDIRDYSSPKELAEALTEYCRDENKYASLFEWKAQPFNPKLLSLMEIQKVHPFIRLAEKIERLRVKSR